MTFGHDPAQLVRWNGRYEAEGYLFGRQPNAFLKSQLPRLKMGMRALCVADGEGRNSVWLARLGLEVTAFDFSPVGVAKARALASEEQVNVSFHECDAYRWDWAQAQYDVVVAIFIQFAPPAERAALFAGMRAALAPDGLLMLQGYRPEQLAYATGGPPDADKLYTEALLRESFPDLAILHLSAHDDVLNEGSAHRGPSAVIDMVAQAPRAAR